ncbi:hypothetical protein [Luteolibacter sp. Populi]|uniref:hypothetical protein n=1 Tax=Luteolibacter sp. Populi TaxID=3230487 RepID=UPI0034655505
MRALVFSIATLLVILLCWSIKTLLRPAPPAPGPNTMSPGTFIENPGVRRFSDKDLEATLKTAIHGSELHWSIEFVRNPPPGKGSTGPAGILSMVSPAAAWFIYMEGAESYWFFNGSGGLEKSQGSVSSLVSIRDGKVVTSLAPPAEVIRRLPLDLQMLYPRIVPKHTGPSL